MQAQRATRYFSAHSLNHALLGDAKVNDLLTEKFTFKFVDVNQSDKF